MQQSQEYVVLKYQRFRDVLTPLGRGSNLPGPEPRADVELSVWRMSEREAEGAENEARSIL